MRNFRLLWTAARTFGEIDGEQRAASFAYYALFSLFPLFALLISVGSMFFAPENVIHQIERLSPFVASTETTFVWQMVTAVERSRGSVSVVSGLILLWSSLRFFQSLVSGVNRAWHTEEIPWWQVPLKNVLMVAVFGSAMLIGLVIPALAQGVRKALVQFADFVQDQIPAVNLPLVVWIFDLSRYLIGGLVLFYALTLLYMLAPRRKVFFREVWMPALFSTLVLQLCQNAFVNYLPKFVNYNAIYGSVGVVMLLLMWVYVSGVVIMFGACLCSAPERLAENSATRASSKR